MDDKLIEEKKKKKKTWEKNQLLQLPENWKRYKDGAVGNVKCHRGDPSEVVTFIMASQEHWTDKAKWDRSVGRKDEKCSHGGEEVTKALWQVVWLERKENDCDQCDQCGWISEREFYLSGKELI